MKERYRLITVTWLKIKICTGIKTGKRSENRRLSGLSTDTKSLSYLMFRGSKWMMQAFEKKCERWPITWISEVLADLKTLYDEVQTRDKPLIFTYPEWGRNEILKAWKRISAKYT